MGGALYVVPIILNLVFTPILLNRLGEAAYGLQTLMNVVIGYFMVADMGIDIPVIKFISEYNAKNDHTSQKKILNNTFQVYSIIGITGMLLIAIFSDFFINKLFDIPLELHSDAKKVFLFTSFGFAGSIISIWGRAVCIGLQRYDIANGVNIINNFMGNVIGVVLVILGFGVVGYIIARVLFTSLSGVAYIFYCRRLLPFFKFQLGFDLYIWKLLRTQIGYGFILRLLGILAVGLDRTLIGAWIGVASVGIYAVPFLIANSSGLLIQSMIHFIFPMTSALHSTNKSQELLLLFLRSTKFTILISSLVFFPLLLFGDKFLILWIGRDFAEKSYITLFLLCASYFFNCIFFVIPNAFMVGIGQLKVFTYFALLKSLIMTIGFFFLIRPFGIAGAGISLLISCIVDVLFFFVTVKKYININIISVLQTSFIKPVSLAMLLGAVFYFFRQFANNWAGFIIWSSAFGIIYIGIGYYMKILEDEKQIVRRLWNSLGLKKEKQ